MATWKEDFFKSDKVRTNDQKETSNYTPFRKKRTRVKFYLHEAVREVLFRVTQDYIRRNKRLGRKKYDFPRHPITYTELSEKWILEGALRDGFTLTDEEEQLLTRFIYNDKNRF